MRLWAVLCADDGVAVRCRGACCRRAQVHVVRIDAAQVRRALSSNGRQRSPAAPQARPPCLPRRKRLLTWFASARVSRGSLVHSRTRALKFSKAL